ncbi:DUF7134 domain-containing protein [Sphaerimonospora mesophila]|uniref:sensor histidine kinase n=1 Tax=Sphaerimonospora mesophila TaxID=37483 RepID=UPI0006E38CDF
MFGRLRAWGRRHSKLVDVLTVSPLWLISLFTLRFYTNTAPTDVTHIGVPGLLLLTLALLIPLIWRRSRPREVFAVVALVCFGQWLANVDITPANLSVLVAMYGVAARCTTAWGIAAGVVTEFGLLLAMIRWGGGHVIQPFLTTSVFVVTIWITGIYTNMRRRYIDSLLERAERAERERDQQARIAAAAERARIARELHDVVAHNVSVMVVQADGAAYALDSDPEQTRHALRTISGTGRQALAEMRRLVGVLRQNAGSPAEEYAPQPGVAQIEELVRHVRDSGLPVELAVSGTPRDLPEGEQLAIYRIVQEALTNTLKHGGPAVRARVEIAYGPGDAVLRIVDDGRGAAAVHAEGGHGLIGMRERASMYGGSVEAGPHAGGGFQVVARIPLGVPV